MEFKDYYQTLGIARDASAEDNMKAFRKLARKYHPDIFREMDAEACMKDVNEAYAVLSDPEKRAAYDQFGQNCRTGQDFRPPPDWVAVPELAALMADVLEEMDRLRNRLACLERPL